MCICIHLPALHVYSTPYEVWPSSVLVSTCPPFHLVVLAALYQKKVITQHDLQKWKGDPQNILLNLILDQYTKPPEDVATIADVLDMSGCKKEAKMLRCKLVLSSQLISVLLQYSYCLFWS